VDGTVVFSKKKAGGFIDSGRAVELISDIVFP
jgi:hypothetical protein